MCGMCFAGYLSNWAIRKVHVSIFQVISHVKNEEDPGKNLPFSVENKWRVLTMKTSYFGSGFAAPFFIV